MAHVVNGVVVTQENTNSFRYRRKHEKQNRSIGSGFLTLMGCGFTMASLLYGSNMIEFYYECQSLFFGGAMLGAIAASILLKLLRKVIHYYLSAILLIISGALYIAVDLSNPDLLKGGAFLSGLSFGISLLTVIIHSGEISVKYLRGSLLSNIQVGLDVSLFVGTLVVVIISKNSTIYDGPFRPFNIIGIIKLISGILALPLAFIFVYESPIFLLEAGNEQEAIKNLTFLRKEPNSMTYEIHNEVENMKTTLKNKSFFNPGEIIPFLKIFAYRLAYALGTSVPVNVYLIGYYGLYLQNTSIYTLYIGRFIAGILPLYLIDVFLGRKIITVISFLGSGILLVIIQAMVSTSVSGVIIDFDTLKIAGLLTVFYYIFLGFGASSVTYVYMSEIFNHSSKTYINALIIILENLAHLIIINFNYPLLSLTSAEVLVFIASSLQILLGALAYGILPETKGTTLLEAEEKSKRLITVQN